MSNASMSADLAAARAKLKAGAPSVGASSDKIPTEDQARREAIFITGEEPEPIDDFELDMVEETQPEPASENKKKPPTDPIDVISQMPGGPSKATLLEWKAKLPEVLFLPLREGELYVYRYLNSFEWRKQLLTQEKLLEDQDALKDAVVQRCLLWPRLSATEMNVRQAGLRDLLYEVIMQSSYFIDPQQAMGLVMRL